MDAVAKHVGETMGMAQQVMQFFLTSTYAQRVTDPSICDFVAGNPQEMPLPAFSEALRAAAVPRNKDWFAYKMSEPESQRIVAASLKKRYGMDIEPGHIQMTNGAFAAIHSCLRTILDPGDEVIFPSPRWFFYREMIHVNSGVAVKVPVKQDWDLDLEAIRKAIGPKTRAVIINSPNNPSGRIYPDSSVKALADLLREATATNGRTIYLLSDEAYSKILYDDNEFTSPACFYENTFLMYTYAKTLLTPGERIGYIALAPGMASADEVAAAIAVMQVASGWLFPSAVLQHALEDLEGQSIDIKQLQSRRDRLVSELRQIGYDIYPPEGTFYLLPRSPIDDDAAFCEMLARQDVFCLPGSVSDIPGYFRISVTASDDMVERSIPGFRRAFEEASR